MSYENLKETLGKIKESHEEKKDGEMLVDLSINSCCYLFLESRLFEVLLGCSI